MNILGLTSFAIVVGSSIVSAAEESSPLTLPVGPIVTYASECAANDDCSCEPGDAEFCGVDGQSHVWSCESFYKFGPRNETGYDNASPLVCEDIAITQPDGSNTDGNVFYPSVSFRCRSLTPPPINMGFTKKCSVTGPNSNFTCYGLATDTNFQPFLNEVAMSKFTCTKDQVNKTIFPHFTYMIITEFNHPKNGGATIYQGFNGTSELNETLALMGTMYATYDTWTDQPSSAPTMSPTAPPTRMMNSAAFANGNSILLLLGIYAIFAI